MREHGQKRWPELAKGSFYTIEHFIQHINSPKNLPRQEPCSYSGENNHWMSGNITCTLCHHLEHYPGSWKENFREIWHPRNNWLRQWYSFGKQTHRHLAQRGGYHIPHQAPASGKIEWCKGLLKTTLRAGGGGTFKQWRYRFNKSHLAGQHLRICPSVSPCPIKTFMFSRRGQSFCSAHQKYSGVKPQEWCSLSFLQVNSVLSQHCIQIVCSLMADTFCLNSL